MVCLGNICINTLYKGDKGDDDDDNDDDNNNNNNKVTGRWRKLHNEEFHDRSLSLKKCIHGFGRKTRWKDATWRTWA
jgi:hypothetical protein